MHVIGLDPGFGNIKVAAGGQVRVIPSLVAVPRRLGMAASGLRLHRTTIVRFEGHEYAIGSGAPLRGTVYESIDESRFLTAPVLALMLGAIALLVEHQHEPLLLVVGLPVAMMQANTGTKGLVKALQSRLSGHHCLEVDGRRVELRIERVWTRAQPLGVWAEWAVQESGELQAGARRSLIGVVDIGFNTVDIFGIQGGEMHAGMMAGAELGVRLLLEDATADYDMPYHQLLWRFSEGALNVTQQAVADWAGEIAGFIRRQWRKVRPDMVVLAGGGAALLQDWGLTDIIRHAVRCDIYLPGDPVTAGARGLEKLGKAMLKRQQMRQMAAQLPRAQVDAHAQESQAGYLHQHPPDA
jgi:hypothetical protein